jgi:hexulose-6-phosphate isomerase
MKKAIGDNLIPKGWTLENGLALIHKAGFDGVELWLGDKPWFQTSTTDAEVRNLRRKVEEAGLVVSNVSNTLDWEIPISSRDPAIREKAKQHIIRQLETAQILGTDAILVVAGLVTEETPYNEVYRRTLDNCCSEQRFLISPREFETFLNDVNSPWVGLHLDVGNIHDTGFPDQWIEIHGPRITRIHVKDVHRKRGRCGDQSVYTNLFLGDNNWVAIRSALEKIRYDGWIIAEMESVYRYAQDQQFFDTSAAMSRFIEGRM